MLIALK